MATIPRVDKRFLQDVGLFMMGTSSAAGWFALFNPGFFDMIQKSVSEEPPPEDQIAAMNMSMNIGLGVTTINGLAIWLANGDRGFIPGLASMGAGGVLYLLYNYMLHEAIKPGVPSWAPTPEPPLPQKTEDIPGEISKRISETFAHLGERVPSID